MDAKKSKFERIARIRKLKAKAVPSHEVFAIPPKYIVIGNFSTHPDKLTALTVNSPSGLSDETFDFALGHMRKQRTLS